MIVYTFYRDDFENIVPYVDKFLNKNNMDVASFGENCYKTITVVTDNNGKICRVCYLCSKQLFGTNTVRLINLNGSNNYDSAWDGHLFSSIIESANVLGYAWCFVTLGGTNKIHGSSKKYLSSLNEKSGYYWNMSNEFHLVGDDKNDRYSWSRIAYIQIASGSSNSKIISSGISSRKFYNL